MSIEGSISGKEDLIRLLLHEATHGHGGTEMKLTIIGASGHGKVVADIARLNGYDAIEFLDDDENLTSCGDYPVVGRTDRPVDNDVFVAIGNADIRERLSRNRNLVTLIHPKAVIADGVEIGEGTVVMAGVVINTGAKIGSGCIVNTASSIDHDCSIGDFCHISVGAHLCGTVVVGNKTWIGAGATVSNNINICGSCMIGAGAVVIKDIKIQGTYVGVPVKMISKINLTGGGYCSTRINILKRPSLVVQRLQHRRAA